MVSSDDGLNNESWNSDIAVLLRIFLQMMTHQTRMEIKELLGKEKIKKWGFSRGFLT
jgi:hypothetical protein